jgi:hypothetical protein
MKQTQMKARIVEMGESGSWDAQLPSTKRQKYSGYSRSLAFMVDIAARTHKRPPKALQKRLFYSTATFATTVSETACRWLPNV